MQRFFLFKILACCFVIYFYYKIALHLSVPEYSVTKNFQKLHQDMQEFDEWARYYHKYYPGSEREYRFNIWLQNKNFIEEQNSLQKSYKLEMNYMGDLSWQEFQRQKMGYSQTYSKEYSNDKIHPSCDAIMSPSINWADKGVVTEVKNQFGCGSCWAFSTTGAVESMWAIKTGNLVGLSEENLIDCSFSYGDQGCAGGLPSRALKYIIANGGIDTEASYPLTSVYFFQCIIPETCTCSYNNATIGATVGSYHSIQKFNETDLECIISSVGPVSVAIDATQPLQFYKSGIFTDGNCSQTELNHAVLAVGYGEMNGSQYYIIKNSWGIEWGIDGYFLMARNDNNMCGISTEAVYPLP